jgi:hypothetical protein
MTDDPRGTTGIKQDEDYGSGVRDPRTGKFLPGKSGNPSGRPRKPRPEYLDSIADACDQETWDRIVNVAARQALQGDAQARAWLSKYIIANKVVIQDETASNPEWNALLKGLSVGDLAKLE